MKRFKLLFYCVLSLIVISCKKGIENIPFNNNPIVHVQALDGDNWIDGVIEGKTISFEFRTLEPEDWNSIPFRFTTAQHTNMVEPASATAPLDLSNGSTIVKATNVYRPLEYSVTAKIYPVIKSVQATIESETITKQPSNHIIDMKFSVASLEHAQLKLELNEGITLISPSSLESIQDLSQPLDIQVVDNTNQKIKTFTLNATTEWTPLSEWENITSNLALSLPNYMTVYKKNNLHGRDNNIGYIIKIPAGNINMQTSYKEKAVSTWFENDQWVKGVVENNREYNLFVGGVSLQYWQPMIRPTVINNRGIEYLGNFFWGDVTYYTSPPTLGIKDGKASISYAELQGDVLSRFEDRTLAQHGTDKSLFTNGEPWDVDAAISGYALPLRNGVLQIADETESSYKDLADRERNFTLTPHTNPMRTTGININIGGTVQNNYSAFVLDGQRMARTLIGVTEDGSILVFVSERYAQTSNVLIDPVNFPSEGSTLLEAATVLKDLGCTDAIAMHQSNFAVAILQDNQSGKDLTRTITRTTPTDLKNSTMIMFR